MEFEKLLQLMVEKGGSDLFITAGVPPSMKVNGKMLPVTKNALSPGADPRVGACGHERKAADGIRGNARMQLCHQRARHRPLPGQRFLPAQSLRHGAAPDRNQHPEY